jgi:hypothetical protein
VFNSLIIFAEDENKCEEKIDGITGNVCSGGAVLKEI